MNHDWVFCFIVLPCLLLLLNIAWLTITFIHECSHAIPALFLTNKDVKIYIGHNWAEVSYAKNPIKLGRLTIYIKRKLSYFQSGGFCAYNGEDITIDQRLIVILSGPIFTAVLSLMLCYFSFEYDWHGSLKLIFMVLAMLSFFSLVFNLYPKYNPNDEVLCNDGYNTVKLIKIKSMLRDYNNAAKFCDEKQYSKAVALLSKVVSNYPYASIYRLLIHALTTSRSYANAIKIGDDFFEKLSKEWIADDYCNFGLVKSRLNLLNESLLDYNRSLQIDPDHKYALNNRAYTYNLLGRYDESICDLDHAILIDKDFAYSYSNRGLAKIKTGKLKDGLKDIDQSLALDPNNAYCYLHLGIYHLDQNNYKEALTNFEKAKAMDCDTHGVDNYIAEVQKSLY